MKRVEYLEAMALVTERMSDGGVFLTVDGEHPNTMTIGWGSMGYIWSRPVFMALVRPTRHSYDILKKQGCFTVSVPLDDGLKQQLVFAGTKSGREVAKFDGHGLSAAPAQKVSAPIVAECALHIECVTKLTQDMTTDQMDEAVRQMAYPGGNLHTMFFGEIVACYRTDQ